MDDGNLYDPPSAKGSLSRSRGRAASFSASSAPPPAVFASSTRDRRQSISSLPSYNAATNKNAGNLSDDEAAPLVDVDPPSGPPSPALSGPATQDPLDAAADKKLWRDGRQSKQQMEEEHPGQHNTADFEQFLAQLYDLTHAIDALENDIDEIVQLRNVIVRLDPKVDVGQESLRVDLDSLAALTTKTGKGIVGLETWLTSLQNWGQQVRQLVKDGKVGETLKEVGEIRYHLCSAQLDFEDAMERIREGAFKEKERRQRTRIWMARHIRAREPGIEDKDVKGLLKAAELGAADGIAESHVTSYAGLFALQNPFTELAELTNAKHAMHDVLDREVLDEVTGKSARKARKVIQVDEPTSSKKTKSKSKSSKKSKKSEPSDAAAASTTFFGSRFGFLSGTRPKFSDDSFDSKFRYVQPDQQATEKDLEWGFARQQQQERLNRRKKLVIALLLVIIAALILFVVLATMRIPDQTVTWSPIVPAVGPVTADPTNVLTKVVVPVSPQNPLPHPFRGAASALYESFTSATASLASAASAAVETAAAIAGADKALSSPVTSQATQVAGQATQVAGQATQVESLVTVQGGSVFQAVTPAAQPAQMTQTTVWWAPPSM
ncbi:hypothetical protein JCM3770_004677 [Rhodotorula araucariae]